MSAAFNNAASRGWTIRQSPRCAVDFSQNPPSAFWKTLIIKRFIEWWNTFQACETLKLCPESMEENRWHRIQDCSILYNLITWSAVQHGKILPADLTSAQVRPIPWASGWRDWQQMNRNKHFWRRYQRRRSVLRMGVRLSLDCGNIGKQWLM